jgi:acetyl esterase/lipase
MDRRKITYVGIFFLVWQACPSVSAENNVEVRRNLVYVERETGNLGVDIYLPKGTGPFPGVLVVHGGAWTIGSRAQLAAVAMALAERGYTAAAISYRLAPQHPFPAQLCDCQAAVRWLRDHANEFKIDPERIAGFGYSAGGQLVALLGTLGDGDFREDGVSEQAPSARLQAVVAGGAPCDFRVMPIHNSGLAYWLGGTRATKPDAYDLASPAAFVTNDDPPMFFFHGARDALVPISSPQRMVERLTSTGVAAEMYTIEDQGHIAALFDRDAMQRAIAFVDRYLKAGSPVASTEKTASNSSAETKDGATDGD